MIFTCAGRERKKILSFKMRKNQIPSKFYDQMKKGRNFFQSRPHVRSILAERQFPFKDICLGSNFALQILI